VATNVPLSNHYEFLQISPNAEPDTIHRVYRFLAVRFHPDNPETGDPEKFFLLKEAYDVLSDPKRRAAYDAAFRTDGEEPDPLSTSIDFMDNMEGELNRRLAVLALLYLRRRENPDRPQVSLFEVETRMGFPREYLEFTIWYLNKKGYICRADNSEFTLTVEGVDFVESQRAQLPILHKLLTSGGSATAPDKRGERGNESSNASSYTGPERRQTDVTDTSYSGPERRVRVDRRKRTLESREFSEEMRSRN
jgi:curved DNA-binding protein